MAEVLDLMQTFDRHQKSLGDHIYSEQFANEHRKGMKVIKGGVLQQYLLYIKGMYFQSTYSHRKALQYYTLSLYNQAVSSNYLRLKAL